MLLERTRKKRRRRRRRRIMMKQKRLLTQACRRTSLKTNFKMRRQQ
jgi:hypothetical protein